MNFCNKCGSKLINNSCPNCSNQSNPNLKKKNNKYLLGFILIPFILVAGIFIYGKSTSKTPEQIASDFSNAISDKDSDNLQKILYCDNKQLEINKTNADILIDYFSKNPSELSELNDNFKNRIYFIDDFPLSIKEVSKKFLFFPVYKVVVKPSFIKVESDFENYKVRILDKTYKDSNGITEIGPLMPGMYNITGELSNSYLNKSEVVDISTFDDNYPEIQIFEDLKTIKIDSDIEDADLYVNDKNTGIKIKDAKNFGPVDSNSNIYAVTKENGKKIISNKYSVNYYDEIYIDFSATKKLEEDFKLELFDLLYNYSSGFAYAVNYDDFSYISPYLKKNSSIYKKQKNIITYFYNQNITESFKSTEMLNYKFDNNTNTGEVTCKEIYSIAKNNNVPKYEEFKNTYTFERNTDGTLVLTDIKD